MDLEKCAEIEAQNRINILGVHRAPRGKRVKMPSMGYHRGKSDRMKRFWKSGISPAKKRFLENARKGNIILVKFKGSILPALVTDHHEHKFTVRLKGSMRLFALEYDKFIQKIA